MFYDVFHSSLMQDLHFSATKEYLVTARSGAYAASTICGCNTRKYHGLMVMPQSFPGDDNYVLLSSLDETCIQEDHTIPLSVHSFPGTHAPEGHMCITAFTANPFPKWWYKAGKHKLLKELLMDNNGTLMIRYSLLTEGSIKLQLRPFLAFRNMHWLTRANDAINSAVHNVDGGIYMNLYEGYDNLFLQLTEGTFIEDSCWHYNFEYIKEKQRGYDYQEDLYTPGYFEFNLTSGKPAIFSGSLTFQPIETLECRYYRQQYIAKKPVSLKEHLLTAADQFITARKGKTTIKAGYFWFGSWGRDTCISLPGLTLATGKISIFKDIAGQCIKTLKNGLIPNAGVGELAMYNTADASLWLIWALQQYAIQQDAYEEIWHTCGSALKDILHHYKTGTSYNIRMDDDYLITAGSPGVALTWMDAVAPEGPVTPRCGKAVEINALWYNAVCFCLQAAKLTDDKDFADNWAVYPEKISKSFANCFWDMEHSYLADCVDGQERDWSVRPNQLFAVSLPFSPLLPRQQRAVMEKIKSELLTPKGLRTLSPLDERYQSRYEGDQPSRDRAYHQGIVWPWLLGHFTEAILKTEGPVSLPFLEKIFNNMIYVLDECCINMVPEIFDGDFPHIARGAVAQAWSVAELIRMEQIIASYKPETAIHHLKSMVQETPRERYTLP